jgi:hypothetical protein
VAFQIGGGTLVSLQRSGANNVMPDSRAFDPIAHRFVRLREQAGTWYWEASPDGVTFVTLGTSTRIFVGQPSTGISLLAGTGKAGKSTSPASYASVQVLVPP